LVKNPGAKRKSGSQQELPRVLTVLRALESH